jgi:hypothetical protein
LSGRPRGRIAAGVWFIEMHSLQQFLTTTEALSLIKAYTKIKRSDLRRAMIHLVEGLTNPDH